MSDVIIFGFGVFVTLIVAVATAFLFWGVSNEPSMLEVPDDEVAAHPLPHQAVPDGVTEPASTFTSRPSAGASATV